MLLSSQLFLIRRPLRRPYDESQGCHWDVGGMISRDVNGTFTFDVVGTSMRRPWDVIRDVPLIPTGRLVGHPMGHRVPT